MPHGRHNFAFHYITNTALQTIVSHQTTMGFLDSFFGKAKPQRTTLGMAQESGGKLIVFGYRRIAAERGCAPTSQTSDEKIMRIYTQVGTAFRNVAEERNERIPAAILNNIVLFFLQVSETMGDSMMQSHLEYELQNFRTGGLRPDYQAPLKLF